MSRHTVAACARTSIDDGDDDEEEEDDFCDLPSPNMERRHQSDGAVGGRRASVVGDEVLDAWMTRGWTMRTSIFRHGEQGLRHLTNRGETDKSVQVQLEEGQKRVNALIEVNGQLKSTLVKKKIKVNALKDEINILNQSLAAACGIEQGARQTSLEDLDEKILFEEKQKQEMMLELNQGIRACESQVARASATNQALSEVNAKNKKTIKEQQAEVRERQKAIRHLERQLVVMQRNQAGNESLDDAIPEDSIADHSKRESDFDMAMSTDTLKAAQGTDSKSMLRGVQAEKYLQEQKRRLQEQKMQSAHTMQRQGRTVADLKSLPGLNLQSLLGIAADDISDGAE